MMEIIGNNLDDFIRNKINNILNITKFPEYDNIYTDSFSELIDKLCILHIRYWYLEDAMAIEKDDIKLAELRRKSESLFKEKRPMLVAAIDKLILKILKGEINYSVNNVKNYKGWEQNEIRDLET